jgi:hypothetical protein
MLITRDPSKFFFGWIIQLLTIQIFLGLRPANYISSYWRARAQLSQMDPEYTIQIANRGQFIFASSSFFALLQNLTRFYWINLSYLRPLFSLCRLQWVHIRLHMIGTELFRETSMFSKIVVDATELIFHSSSTWCKCIMFWIAGPWNVKGIWTFTPPADCYFSL